VGPPKVDSNVRNLEPSVGDDAARLKALVQEFARNFGLLVTKQTPCGFPLSPSHAHCLMILLQREREGLQTSQTELGARLTIDKSNIARLSRRLETSGHATQAPDPEDGRGRLLRLTTKGKRMAEKLEVASDQRFGRVLAAIPASKQPALFASLSLLIEAVRCLDEAG
jgi:DNA-binding MarR family transcriptional regulator